MNENPPFLAESENYNRQYGYFHLALNSMRRQQPYPDHQGINCLLVSTKTSPVAVMPWSMAAGKELALSIRRTKAMSIGTHTLIWRNLLPC